MNRFILVVGIFVTALPPFALALNVKGSALIQSLESRRAVLIARRQALAVEKSKRLASELEVVKNYIAVNLADEALLAKQRSARQSNPHAFRLNRDEVARLKYEDRRKELRETEKNLAAAGHTSQTEGTGVEALLQDLTYQAEANRSELADSRKDLEKPT